MATEVGSAPQAVQLALYAMATRFELLLAGDDPVRLRAVGEEALAEITACELAMSAFRPGSVVSRANRRARREPVEMDADTFELLEEALAIHRASGGVFDVTLGALMRRLGFRGRTQAIEGGVHGCDGLELDPHARTVRFLRDGIELDLGGIAKGHALDRAADVVRQHGVASALLHGGTSTVVGIGAPPGGTGWRVGLGAAPDAPVVELRDAALAVSAPHGREVVIDGRRIGHVLDPRTGRSADNGVTCAAVLARSARTADAWSTALLVLGEGGALPLGLAARVALREADGVRWIARGATALGTARFVDGPTARRCES